jgi:ATP-dependent RNA helicase DeaD
MPEAARPARRADAEPQGADERRERKPREEAEFGMETFRIDVGHAHGVKPANIVGAIANEAGLEARYIGRIDIHDDYSTVDLPEGMPGAADAPEERSGCPASSSTCAASARRARPRRGRSSRAVRTVRGRWAADRPGAPRALPPRARVIAR